MIKALKAVQEVFKGLQMIGKSSNQSKPISLQAPEFWPLNFLGYKPSNVATLECALSEGYTNPYFFAVLSSLAKLCLSQPKMLFNAEYEPIDNPFISKILRKPNELEDWQTFAYRLFANALMGDVYVFAPQMENMPYSSLIVPITSDVKETRGSLGQVISYTIYYRGRSYLAKPENVLHISLPNLYTDDDNGEGFGVMKSAYLGYDTSNNVLKTEAGAFAGVGANKLISPAGDMPMTPKERDAIQEKIDSITKGHDKVGTSSVSSVKMNAIDIGFIPKDYAFPEMQEMAIQFACMMFGVAPQLYGSQKASTYNNVKEMKEDRIISVILPMCESVYESLSGWLFEFGNIGLNKGDCIKVDESQIPMLNRPNLEYLTQTTGILVMYNTGQLSKQQAFIQLNAFDYSEEEINEMLSNEQRQEEAV